MWSKSSQALSTSSQAYTTTIISMASLPSLLSSRRTSSRGCLPYSIVKGYGRPYLSILHIILGHTYIFALLWYWSIPRLHSRIRLHHDDYHAHCIPGAVSVHTKCWLVRQTHQQSASQHRQTDRCMHHSHIIFNCYVASKVLSSEQSWGMGEWKGPPPSHSLSMIIFFILLWLDTAQLMVLLSMTNASTWSA